MLLLWTKDVRFLFKDEIYRQTDSVTMGWPMGPIFAGTFMVELEKAIAPTLDNLFCKWKRYVEVLIVLFKLIVWMKCY